MWEPFPSSPRQGPDAAAAGGRGPRAEHMEPRALRGALAVSCPAPGGGSAGGAGGRAGRSCCRAGLGVRIGVTQPWYLQLLECLDCS